MKHDGSLTAVLWVEMHDDIFHFETLKIRKF